MKRLRVGLLTAVTFLSVSAAGASSAQAVDTPVSLDNGFLKLGGLSTPIDIINGPDQTGPDAPLVVTADLNLATGNFVANPGDFDFPPFTGTQGPITLTVDLIPLEDITGNFETPASPTGKLTTLESDYRATIALSGLITASCELGPIPLDLSTEFASSPFLGDRFDPVLGLPNNGAVADNWATLPAVTTISGDCGIVNSLAGGPGGLWLAQGLAAPATPVVNPPVVNPPKKAKKCKKAKKKGKKAAVAKKCKKKKKKK